ncbi:MAG: hypothetical protein C7B44_12430 [Sulfobacillus thermosulfidooxidans]|nr:MAG: hypothetical protein C7B44_12430 [Sulfobacillus thermosulfidooxidans]
MNTQEAQHLVTTHLERLFADPDLWRQWATTLSRFHRYSLQNTILIALQRPDATYVAGYKQWQKLGRWVKKGEKGLTIFAPILRRAQPDESAPTDPPSATDAPAAPPSPSPTVVGFRAVTVFDVSQTDGTPLTIPTPQCLTATEGAELRNLLITHVIGVPVQFQSRAQLHDAHGQWDPSTQTITVADDLAPAHQLKTLLHEWAHSVAIPDPATARTRDIAAEELIAETTALVIASRLGLDTTAYSLPYVGHWAHGQPEALRTVTTAISQRVQLLWNALEAAASQHDALAALITPSSDPVPVAS